jgi:hypothetical protein
MIWRILDAALLVLGAGAIVGGVAQWSRPAGWIVAGAVLVALGLLPTRPTRRS